MNKVEPAIKENMDRDSPTAMIAGGQKVGISRWKLFLALSRTPHGLLDMAAPPAAVLIWLGELPAITVIILGCLAMFAGYTAVYALNDIMDYREDRLKLQSSPRDHNVNYLDAAFMRHPLAQGMLTMREAVVWAGAWGVISLAAAAALNPVCAGILLLGCLLETAYCRLFHVSCLRAVVSGVVKTLGAMAAVLAVDSRPDPGRLALVFFWLFFWEIGGQNIPADWHDTGSDAKNLARTIPVCLGRPTASVLILTALFINFLLSIPLFIVAPGALSLPFLLLVLAVSWLLNLRPAWRLWKQRPIFDGPEASRLFFLTSHYPLSVLILVFSQIVVYRFI